MIQTLFATKKRWFGAGIVLVLFAALLGMLPLSPNKVAAAGETYSWDGAKRIHITGGNVVAKDDAGRNNYNSLDEPGTTLPGQPEVFTGFIIAYNSVRGQNASGNGCQVFLKLTLQGNNTGLLQAYTPPGGPVIGAQFPTCSNSQSAPYNNITVTMSGPRPGSGSQSQEQRSVHIFVNSPVTFGNSAPSIQGTLKDASGKIIDGPVPVNKVDIGPDQLPQASRNADYPFVYELDPGTYTFCADPALVPCWTFTKGTDSISQELGELPGQREINVELHIPFDLPVSATKTYGPATVDLFDADNNLVKEITIPADTLKASDPGGTAYRSGTFVLGGAIEDVAPGKYKVCLTAIEKCQDVTKKDGSNVTVIFNLTADEGSALSAARRRPDCYLTNDPLSWLLCPVFNGASRASNWIFTNILTPFLVTQPIGTNSSDSSFQIWSTFRLYGDILLVIAVLVLIIGQMMSNSIAQAYNVRKLLPRVLLVAILINLSVYIVALLVDITNVAGKSLSDIMTAPIKKTGSWSFSPDAVQGIGVFAVGLIGALFIGGTVIGVLTAVLTSGGGSAGFLKIALYAAMFAVLPIILAIIAIFATLLIRKGLILFLVLISPVAFALYCLPNTEKYFKKWWDLLLEALLVYPIIVVIFAIADILSVTILSANGITSSQLVPNKFGTVSLATAKIVAFLVALALQFMPLLAIPFAFRFAGKTLSAVQQAITTGGAKVNEVSQKRGEMVKRDFRIQKMQGQETAYNAINRFGDRHRWARHIPIIGTNSMGRVAGGYNIQAALSAQRAQVAKEINDQINNGDDSEVRALMVDKRTARRRVNNGIIEYQSAGGAWVSEAAINRGQQRWKGNQMAYQAALTYEMRKATSQAEVDNLVSSYSNLVRSWGLNADQARGMWTGSAFANQQTNLEYKHYKWDENTDTLRMDGLGLMTEIDEKKGNYQMLQQSADTWTTMSQEMLRARQVLDGQVEGDRAQAQETLQRGARIAHSMRSSSMSMQFGEEEGQPIPAGMGGDRSPGAGAPARVQEEVNAFVQMANLTAGQYQGPSTDNAPTPPPLPPTAPEESLDRRDRPGTS